MGSHRSYVQVVSALASWAVASGASAQAQTAPQSPVDQAIATEQIDNQFIVSGFAGRAFGDELDDGGATFGAAFDYLWNGVVGVELLAGFSPDIALNTLGAFDDSSVDSSMANAIVAVPLAGSTALDDRLWQPYFSGGLGAMQFAHGSRRRPVRRGRDTAWREPRQRRDGLLEPLGIHGDVRWFNGLDDDADAGALDSANALAPFSFWRGNVGSAIAGEPGGSSTLWRSERLPNCRSTLPRRAAPPPRAHSTGAGFE